ncbi:2-hydroxyacid dehydrogenase [Streptomyces sulphureus]|uniref:2-hydroxyacid dehydrogenase n=1 Tax=Streptomyces sulphureus TaxID=47758 RepID=UPI00099767C6|nr:2-hydroxyacid dehydrogenase [Streptomyces sulphureus]
MNASTNMPPAPAPEAREVWLPFRPETVEGLPTSLTYRHWDGGEEFPADPAHCAFYVPPYMRGREATLRPLPVMPNLRVVQMLMAGIDALEPSIPHLPDGTLVCNAQGVHDTSTAELALSLVLASLRGVPDFVRQQDAGIWNGGFRESLADKRVLIVGYGAIGAAIEERLVPFEVAEVLRVARHAREAPRGPVRTLAELDGLLPLADAVILCTPLTDQTRHLADAAFLGRMKDGALLVNIARGAVVDTDALLAELGTPAGPSGPRKPGRLRAALDVTEPEPLPEDHPLWQAPGTLITPHVGGPTSAFRPRAERLLREQLGRWARGAPLDHVRAVA